MNVTVFGATGAIGQLVVAELLGHDHEVTAYIRNAGKVPADWEGRVRIIVGTITDADRIDEAIRTADAVISALGPSMDRAATGLPLVEGTRLILQSMERHGVTRYIGNGTPSVHDVRDRVGVQVRAIGWIAKTFLPRGYDEMLGMSRVVMDSTLDWTIVRFSAPTNGPRSARPRIGFFGHERIGLRASRVTIAAFTARQIDDTRYVRSAPAISN